VPRAERAPVRGRPGREPAGAGSPVWGCAEHDAMEMKPAATDRLLSLDWYSETSHVPESAISSLGALGLWSGMLGARGARRDGDEACGDGQAALAGLVQRDKPRARERHQLVGHAGPVERHARRCAPAPWLVGGHLRPWAGGARP
jgi:hypothetical protein